MVLPARIPNLLVNGSSGIAVGMATNILLIIWEVIDGLTVMIDNKINGKETDVEELMEYIKGPDFPPAQPFWAKAASVRHIVPDVAKFLCVPQRKSSPWATAEKNRRNGNPLHGQ